MTSYERKGERPSGGAFNGYDHVHLWVSNAKQAATWYSLRFGFHVVGYKGLENGSRDVASWVLKQNDIFLVLSSPLNPVESVMGKRIGLKGDAVRDVAFNVTDARALYEKAVSRGATSILAPEELKDEHGTVIIATVQAYGDSVHTFVQRNEYKGVFLPGYGPAKWHDPLVSSLPSPGLLLVDHVVGNQEDLAMEPVCRWYERMLDFHRFWSVDDKQMSTAHSALRSIVMTDWDEKVKTPINEPAVGLRKSQIQEYVDYHGGAGVQHVALLTDNIMHAIPTMKARGAEFLTIPATYYQDVRKRLAKAPITVAESIDELERLGILIDFDDKGYLLQLFTKPVQDRPTLFYEIIQRRNHTGFGAGNFKALFEAIERDQAARGNLGTSPAAPASPAPYQATTA